TLSGENKWRGQFGEEDGRSKGNLGTSKTELDLLQLGLAVLVSGSWRSMVSVSPSSAKKVYLHLCSSLLLDCPVLLNGSALENHGLCRLMSPRT
ncbi:hypothetical protein HID58_007485, partial [Brassica napus]